MENDFKKVTVVIPSLDPDEKLLEVVKGIKEIGFEDVLLVDDGSAESNKHYFDEAAAIMPGGVTVLHHEVNKGKGAAIKTALTWYLENRKDSLGVVTVDGDNQHRNYDTKACVIKMLETGDLVLGVRDFSGKDVPKRSRVGNRTASLIIRIFGGIKISDTQTGLRAFPNSAIPLLSTAHGERFEYETNMLLILKPNGIGLSEQVIDTVYIEENKSSHYRAFKDSWRIFKVVIRNFAMYAMNSLISSTTDNLLYLFFLFILAKTMDVVPNVLALVPARIISSIVNFFLNKKLAFSSNEKNGKALLKYYLLALGQVIVVMVILPFLARWWGIHEDSFLNVFLKMLIETIMFFCCYNLQKNWIFHAGKQEKKTK